jgi:hypothetical protein
MSFEDDLTAASQSLDAAAQAYHGKIGEIDTRVDTAEGEYDALAANLVGVVKSEMESTYYVSSTGLDTNDGKTAATPFATVGRVFNFVPDSARVDVRIDSTEANPLVVTACSAERRHVRFRPFVNGATMYLKWRGAIGFYGGSFSVLYDVAIDYDGNEYNGTLFVGADAAISLGSFTGSTITVKNATHLNIVNSHYTYGGLVSVYLWRVTLLDALGDPYDGTTSVFNRALTAGLAAYEIWQGNFGPNFAHIGTVIGANSRLVGG